MLQLIIKVFYSAVKVKKKENICGNLYMWQQYENKAQTCFRKKGQFDTLFHFTWPTLTGAKAAAR